MATTNKKKKPVKKNKKTVTRNKKSDKNITKKDDKPKKDDKLKKDDKNKSSAKSGLDSGSGLDGEDGPALDELGNPLPIENPEGGDPICIADYTIDYEFDITDPINPPFRCISVLKDQNDGLAGKMMDMANNPSSGVTELASGMGGLPGIKLGGGRHRTRRHRRTRHTRRR